MSCTKEELESFHQFAAAQLNRSEEEFSSEQLLWLWRDAHGDDVHAAIREGLADIEAGRTAPFRQASDEFRKRNHFPPREA